MKLEEVIQRFVERKSEPSNANELLDFIQQLYVIGTIPIQEYRTLFKEVHDLGATKPDYYFNERIPG